MSTSHLIVFRSRLIPGIEGEYRNRSEALHGIVSAMPGLVDARDYIAPDGERVSLIEFDSAEHLAAWRDHPEHIQAQADGRARYFSSYHIQICQVQREARFEAAAVREGQTHRIPVVP